MSWRANATRLATAGGGKAMRVALTGPLALRIAAAAAMASWRNRLLSRAHAQTGQPADRLRDTGADLAAANVWVRLANDELSLQNGRFRAALENMSQALCMVDAEQRLIVCNRRFVELFGLDPALALPGTDMRDLAGDAGHADARTMRDLQAEHRRLSGQQRPAAFLHERPDQKVLAVSHQPMPDGAWVATYEDVTERRRAEARIAFMAHHDALTGLANRVLYRQRIEYIVATGGEDSGDIAVLLLDLDHFKEVNDTLGHGVGDALLEAVGLRLRGCTRESDLVARLGGDEFAVIQFPATQPAEAATLAERIVETIGKPYAIEGERVLVSASIGVAVARVAGASAELLLKYADMALYQAKANGRAGFCFYDPAMDQQMQTRRALSADLRDALALGQFEVHYQPLVDLQEERICGFEALIRWRHPERGLVSPAQFIPLAEETGLIQTIGEWVLREACTEATRWPPQVKVAVNLSPRQFRGNDVARAVVRALEHSGLTPERLEVEITESLLLQDGDDVLEALCQLRALGVGVALDDFGTGYSSLSYLRKFPFSKLKIDQSFVRGMTEREDCIIIIQAVAAMAQRLGMIVTAEGIETEEELAIIRAARCSQGQGYLFGRPQNAAATLALLSEAGSAGVAERMMG
jgi:diguanylate cyclase (GGDEF)-like protein/PAS domain S-box-containing protein